MTKKQKTNMGICFLLTFGTFMSQQVFAVDPQEIENNLTQQLADAKNKAAQGARDQMAQDAQNVEHKVASEFRF
ncbi:MAG: hypothetical protein K2P90_01075 [Holosporales bacterium]|nr:hypothetical protein [Holosporales bacterium]